MTLGDLLAGRWAWHSGPAMNVARGRRATWEIHPLIVVAAGVRTDGADHPSARRGAEPSSEHEMTDQANHQEHERLSELEAQLETLRRERDEAREVSTRWNVDARAQYNRAEAAERDRDVARSYGEDIVQRLKAAERDRDEARAKVELEHDHDVCVAKLTAQFEESLDQALARAEAAEARCTTLEAALRRIQDSYGEYGGISWIVREALRPASGVDGEPLGSAETD